ncbi:site-2 protease family protein [Microbacteriaceae bacterium 4G12]
MKNKSKGAWGIFAALGAFLLSKMKWVFAVVKLAKFSTAFSMLLSLGAYALVYGWRFAVALIYLMFVHEMGHLWAAKRIGLKTSPAIFIPFMGAVVGLKELPKNAKDEAFVAYMGPLFGLASFLPAIPLYISTHDPFWALVIMLGGTLNFFNLIPITPLDGGRIVSVVSTKIWGIGLIILLVYSIMTVSILGFFICFLGGMQWYKTWKQKGEWEELERKIELYKQYITSIKEEVEETGGVHRSVFALRQERSLTTEKSERQDVIPQLLHYFDPFDSVVEEEEKEEQMQGIQQAIVKVEEKIQELIDAKQHLQHYYNAPWKTRVIVFLLYIILLLVLGYCTYYGNEILQQYPELRRR